MSWKPIVACDGPVRVVLAPDVLGLGLVDQPARRVLDAWVRGAIRPVVSKDLLQRYVALWRVLGLPEPVVRGWLVWFTATDRCDTLPAPSGGAGLEESLRETLVRIRAETSAEWVVTDRVACDGAIAAAELLRRLSHSALRR